MLDKFLDFWIDGAGAMTLAIVVISVAPLFILWLNVSWILRGN